MRHLPTCALALLLAASGGAAFGEEYDSYDGEDYGDGGGGGRPMIGIVMTPVPSNVLEREGLNPDEGVLVRRVYPGTSAEEMGLRPGDVIVSINDQPIDSMTRLREVVSGSWVGQEVNIEVSRDGDRELRDGFLGEWPDTIPVNQIDAEAERKYREMQQARVARRESQLVAKEQEQQALESEVASLRQRHDRNANTAARQAAATADPASDPPAAAAAAATSLVKTIEAAPKSKQGVVAAALPWTFTYQVRVTPAEAASAPVAAWTGNLSYQVEISSEAL